MPAEKSYYVSAVTDGLAQRAASRASTKVVSPPDD